MCGLLAQDFDEAFNLAAGVLHGITRLDDAALRRVLRDAALDCGQALGKRHELVLEAHETVSLKLQGLQREKDTRALDSPDMRANT